MTHESDIEDNQTRPGGFWRAFAALFALGFAGVVSLIPLILFQLEGLSEQLADVPMWVPLVAALVQSAVLVAIAVALGVLLAPKVGLTSLVADRVRRGMAIRPRLLPDVGLAIGLGLALAVAILAIDAVTLPLLGVDIDTPTLSWLPQLGMGILYGGITEELLLRWGLMTLFVWVGHRIFERKRSRPSAAVLWGAIIVAAVLFGIGHLPAMATYAELTPLLIVRTVALNAMGGIVFGWLYWRRSLEAAIVSHAFVHVGFAILRPLFERLG